MLKVIVHAGLLKDRTAANQLAVLDIAYQRKSYMADYMVALSLHGVGELAPAMVMKYPRWSASVWDLTARALAQLLYRSDTVPPSAKVDHRCAYATRICATIEQMTAESRGVEIADVEILQRGKKRGLYTASFNEDILGPRTVEFEYGCKNLNHAELLLRGICWAYFQSEVLGPEPELIMPVHLNIDGTDRFHVASLAEPAMTGFRRYQAEGCVKDDPGMVHLPRTQEYVRFLMEG